MHPEKALEAIVVTPLEIVMLVKEVQFKNTLGSIIATDPGHENVVKLHPEKEFAPMLITALVKFVKLVSKMHP